MPGGRAGSPIAVYAQVQCREPKTGQPKVQLYCEDDSHCQSGYIIYLWSEACGRQFSHRKQQQQFALASLFILLLCILQISMLRNTTILIKVRRKTDAENI